MQIKSDKLTLQLVEASDPELDKLLEGNEDIYNMSEVRLYPPSMPSSMRFRIENEEELIGEISLKTIKWYNHKAELSIALKKEFQGKGLAREALLTLIKFCFERMNLHRLEAEVIEFNKESINLVENLGFRLEGRLREAKYAKNEYYDVLRYGLLRHEWAEN
ncbi:MAG: GNAT family protein [bacterium]